MRQIDFAIGKTNVRYKSKRRQALTLHAMKAPLWYTASALRKVKRTREDIRKVNLRSSSISRSTFIVNVYSDEWAVKDFKFQVKEIQKVCEAIRWSARKTERNGYKCPVLTACCILLRKLSSPCRRKDVEYLFGMHSSALRKIFWEVVESFVAVQGYLLTDLRENLLRSRAELYAGTIRVAGAPLDSCVSFMDCTKMRIARPGGHGRNQRSCYLGHKRMHCFIYQTINTPDGLIFSLYGPEVRRRHDVTLLRESGIEEKLQSSLFTNGRQFYLYADAAYVLRPWMQISFARTGATLKEEVYNTRMSAVRVAVEWTYKDLKQMWSLNDFSRALKVRQSPIGLSYRASALLHNSNIRLGAGGQVQTHFK